MPDWAELKEGRLDPRTPAEYLEAVRRITQTLMDTWDEFPDGDGVNASPDDDNQTKTDMFRIISGCCQYALDNIRDFNKIVESTGSEV